MSKNKINILFIADIDIKSHNLTWIRFFLKKSDCNCFLICLDHQYRIAKKDYLYSLEEEGLKIQPPIHPYSTFFLFKNVGSVFNIKRCITKNNIDLIHIMYAEPNALWSKWKWFFKVPMILTFRGTDILKTIKDFYLSQNTMDKIIARGYSTCFKAFDLITCTSKEQVKWVKKINQNVDPQIIRTGIDMQLINSLDSNTTFLSEIKKPIVLFPRSMQRIYNHEFSLKAISKLNSKILNTYCFIFLDSNSSDRDYFNYIKTLSESIDAEFHFLPSLSKVDLLQLISKSVLVVMNPNSDGSPVTAMEVMALRKPLIMPDLPYDSEIFGNAFFFEKEKDDKLTETMEYLLNTNSEKIQNQIENAHRDVINQADFNNEMQKLLNEYLRILS